MLRLTKAFSRRYYDFLMRFFKMHQKTRLIAIDFHKPWWNVLWQQRGMFSVIFSIESCVNAFLTVPALVLEWLFRTNRHELFIFFVLLWLVFVLVEYLGDYFTTRAHLQSVQSIHYNAMQFLLKIDPIFHAHSNKGKIIAKIYRAAESLEESLRMSHCELLQTFIGAVTVIITFLSIDIKLGLLALSLLSVLSLVFIIIFSVTAQVMMPACIEADDRVKNIGTESLVQMSLIRSTFSSGKIDDKLRTINKKRLSIEGTLWRSYYVIGTITKILYVIIFGINGFYILSLVKQGVIAHTTGIALLLTFFNGTYQLLQIGQFIYRFRVHLERINDLFVFMRQYGRPSFPVLEPVIKRPVLSNQSNFLSVEIKNIRFSYNQKLPIFKDYSFLLKVPHNQPNKLYGIVGFSGQGKSTLLSILGGQLRPQEGIVRVNGLNIYTLNDEMRRGIMTLQNQSNSSLYGTVKYNLTFGLPDKNLYSNHELIGLLEKIGLWEWLKHKRGLDTIISEGGLTLSSGQRQRLNFLSLYLRARTYKPFLVLIDEPTSNLDEVSEKIVTEMIVELAQQSLVLVVAHRLRTLEKTMGILDLSLMNDSKTLMFRTHDELMRVSYYYRQLRAGNISIDSLDKAPLVLPAVSESSEKSLLE